MVGRRVYSVWDILGELLGHNSVSGTDKKNLFDLPNWLQCAGFVFSVLFSDHKSIAEGGGCGKHQGKGQVKLGLRNGDGVESGRGITVQLHYSVWGIAITENVLKVNVEMCTFWQAEKAGQQYLADD